MTAIVRTRDFTAPPITRAGLGLPGLGHLLVGEWIVGIGLLVLDAVLVASGWLGFPRIGSLLIDEYGGLSLHAVVALATWVGLAGGLWWTAFRRAYPRPLSEEEYNANTQVILRTLRRHRTGMMGLFGVLFLITITLVTPMIAPFDPIAVSVGEKLTPPCREFLMGTDEFGRDVFSRLLYGGRISLAIGFVAVVIAATLGTTLGATAAFVGGWVDRLIMFLVDVLLSLPRLVLLLTIVGMFRVTGTKGIFLIVVILGTTAWMAIARIVRSEVLSLKEREFVQAARALGMSQLRILFVHLVPNSLAPVIVFCSLAIGGTMLAEAGLSFLGLGVPPPTSTWGVMVNDGREPLRTAPWIAVFPGLAIMTAVLSFNLLGDGLRDALDPKLRG
ncbi:MAG: ABC transporter permease [Myxococcota bacterium]